MIDRSSLLVDHKHQSPETYFKPSKSRWIDRLLLHLDLWRFTSPLFRKSERRLFS